jgi:hypothetical protein
LLRKKSPDFRSLMMHTPNFTSSNQFISRMITMMIVEGFPSRPFFRQYMRRLAEPRLPFF